MRTFTDRFELDPLAPRTGVVFAEVGDEGLDVGVHAHEGWEGYFAVTHDFYPASSVFHTDMEAIPPSVAGDGIGEAVFAVQTGSTKITSDVNFVTVNTYASKGDIKWQVGYSAGKYSDAERVSLAQLDHPPDSSSPTTRSASPCAPTGTARSPCSSTTRRSSTPPTSSCSWSHRSSPTSRCRPRTSRTPRGSRTSGWRPRTRSGSTACPKETEVRIGAADRPTASGAADAEGTARLQLPLPQAHGTAPLAVRLPGERDWRQVSDAFVHSGGDRYRASVEGSA